MAASVGQQLLLQPIDVVVQQGASSTGTRQKAGARRTGDALRLFAYGALSSSHHITSLTWPWRLTDTHWNRYSIELLSDHGQ
jgi:hypothetical protein